MDGVFGVRMAGPLAPYGPGFAVGLTRLGYTRLSARGQLAMVAHLSGWLAGEGLGVEALSGAVVGAFLAARGAVGCRACLSPKALGPLLDYLRGLGVALQVEMAEPTPAEVVLECFRGYLTQRPAGSRLPGYRPTRPSSSR